MMNYTNQLILDALYRLRADCNDPIIDESLQVICTAVHQWEYQDLFSHLKIQKICISEETIQVKRVLFLYIINVPIYFIIDGDSSIGK